MSTFKPAGWPTVAPRIVTDEVAGVVDFMKKVFGAAGELRTNRPVEMKLGDSILLISDGGSVRERMPAFLYVYVEDTDATYHRAVAARAETVESPADMPYGDRRATVRDPWGNLWQLATHRG